MQLVQRISGKCDSCSTLFDDMAIEVLSKENKIIKYTNGDTKLEEKNGFSYTLCPSCWYEVRKKCGDKDIY